MRQGDDPATYPARAIAALEKARGDGIRHRPRPRARPALSADRRASTRPCRSCSRVVESQPALVDAAILLSTAQEGAGQPEQAMPRSRKCSPRIPARSGRRCGSPRSTKQDEQWNAAAEALARAQTLNPRAPMIARRRAVALLSAGRAAEARDLLQATIASGRPGREGPDPAVPAGREPARRQGSRRGAGHRQSSSSRPIPRTSAAFTCCRSSSRTRVTSRAPSARCET